MVVILPIDSKAEREPLLMKQCRENRAAMGAGLDLNAMRKHLTEPGKAAAERIQAQAVKEGSLECVAEIDTLARQVASVSPHQLCHGLAYRLWKTATSEAIRQILGHRRVATTLTYGKPTEDDLRAALEDASWIR